MSTNYQSRKSLSSQSISIQIMDVISQVEVDVNAAEKLMIEWDDFMHAFENDIKPGFGAADEKLDAFLSRGIINWGDPVQVGDRSDGS